MNIPEGITHPAVAEAAAHHATMLAERNAASAALKAAERNRPRAVEQDSAAYADALAKGAKDPGEKATAKADEAIHQAKRRSAALDRATVTASTAVVEAVRQHRDAIAAELQERLTTADRAWTEAIDQLEAAGAERGRSLSALDWIERGDYDRAAPRVGGWVPALMARRMGTSDSPAMFPEVMQALREVTDPPESTAVTPSVGGSLARMLGVGDSVE